MNFKNYSNEIQDFDDASQKELLADWQNGNILDFSSIMEQNSKSFQDFLTTKSSMAQPIRLGETVRGMSNVSPLATYKFYNQSSNEIVSKYFIDANPPEEGTFTYVSDIRSDLTQYIKDVKDFYYYEKQDIDHFAFKVILFSSTEATKLKECFEVCKPKGREVLMFVEDNKGDTSGTYGAIRFSEELLQFFTNKDKQYKNYNFLSYDLQDNKNVYDYLRKSVPGITEEQLKSIFHKGYIEDKRIGLVKDFFQLASAFSSGLSFIPGMSWLTNDAARTGMSSILGKAIQLIEQTRLEENRWQPKPPKKENGQADDNYRYDPLISSGEDENGAVNITKIVKVSKYMLDAQNVVMRNVLLVRKDFSQNTKATGILEFLYSKYLDSYNIALSVLNELEELSEMEFLKYGTKAYNALLCGVWNGLTDAVSGLFALVKMFYDGITLGKDFVQNIEKYLPILLEQYDETIQVLKNISFSETAKYLYSKLKQINLTFDPVACAYFVGYAYGFIISLIIEIVLTAIATGGTITLPLIIEKLEETIFGIFRLGWGMVKGAVKAVRSFARFVVRSIEDLIKGFQELLNFLKKGWQEFKRIFDEVFVKLKNIKNESRIKPRSNYFNSVADPVADILGAAIKSHPERLKNIMLELKNNGVEIVFRSDEALGYSPGLSKGQPGQVIIHENASISAWEHEYTHFLNDQENGFLGMSSLFDSNYRVYTELNAYTKEIEFVKSLSGNNQNILKQLKLNFDDELNYIINNFGKVQDKNILDKIEHFKNL